MAYRIRIDGLEVEAEIVARRPRLRVRLGEVPHEVVSEHLGSEEFQLTVDGKTYRGWRCALGDELHVRLNGRTYRLQFAQRASPTGAAAAQEEIRASMPGVVVAVHCEPGQAVKAGDRLLTLESMKLQMTIVAAHQAAVAQVHVAPQAVFERGALLVSFAAKEEQATAGKEAQAT
jgi:3-methylcrotonyl-CoA carboxylase alpha subunit